MSGAIRHLLTILDSKSGGLCLESADRLWDD
jgi:hypothetical protein